MKINQFIEFLRNEKPLGAVRGDLYTIEFQKRGLPHCHTLLWVFAPPGGLTADDIDKCISAEIPDPTTDPCGYKVVTDLMMHGPCGLANLSAPCMEGEPLACSKNFPKLYNDATYFNNNGCAHYKRRRSSITIRKLNTDLDNTYVVPFNRALCLTFHAHINVEYCGWSMVIKYLFKYISKGTDCVAAKISKPIGEHSSTTNEENNIDEIQNFIDARFLCAHEACWRIFNFLIHHRDPPVQILAVHLENMQIVTFRATQSLQSVINNPGRKKTTLTEWLLYNRDAPDGRNLTYLDFPMSYSWVLKEKIWKKQKVGTKFAIGRLSYMHPSAGEVFYLRMLLCHQKGSTSFEDLRTVNNTIYSTYRLACEVMGLLGDDREWSKALEEASCTATAAQLRTLFVHILLYCDVGNPLHLWQQQWNIMSDEISMRTARMLSINKLHINQPELQYLVLYEIEVLLREFSKTLSDFGLPDVPPQLIQDLRNRLIMEEKNYDRDALRAQKQLLENKLNCQQRCIYNRILSASINNQQELLFVYGHGGTGKTFLWKAVITALRSNGKIVLAVASSGIDSLLLPSGQTAHSRFKLTLELTDESMCNIRKKTNLAALL
ncbi:uncharacterized protein [Rutidosis leptorrhynchoides]|uniref:uncharacterized protein n=1 Tax=Rutidosis leptorrhynchoides TaxID=125765 RepID=UPI003A9966C9